MSHQMVVSVGLGIALGLALFALAALLGALLFWLVEREHRVYQRAVTLDFTPAAARGELRLMEGGADGPR